MCGKKRGTNMCIDCVEWHSDQVYHCDRPECPICWPYWAARMSARITDRLWAAKLKFGIVYKATIFSPPPEEWHLSMGTLRSKHNRLVKEAGAVGGATVVHLARFRDEDDKAVRWTDCGLNPRADDPVDAVAEYSPHFHEVTTGWLMNSDEFHEKFGWTYKHLGYIGTKEQMFGYVYYCLTHAVVVPGRKVTSYFGLNRPGAQVVVGKRKKIEIVICEKCGGHVHKHDVKGNRLQPLRKVTVTTLYDFPEYVRKGKKLVRSYRRRDRITDWSE